MGLLLLQRVVPFCQDPPARNDNTIEKWQRNGAVSIYSKLCLNTSYLGCTQ